MEGRAGEGSGERERQREKKRERIYKYQKGKGRVGCVADTRIARAKMGMIWVLECVRVRICTGVRGLVKELG